MGAPPFVIFEGWDPQMQTAKRYRFAWPRASFLTLGFFDPRGYSRGFSGFSALRFLRAVRFAFFRSSLLNAVVFAMNQSVRPFLRIVLYNLTLLSSTLKTVGTGLAKPSTQYRHSTTPDHLHSSEACAPLPRR